MQIFRQFSFAIIILIAFTLSSNAQTSFDFSHYESFLKEHIDQGKIAGAVSLVSQGDRIVHDQSYGYDNIVEKSPMTSDKLFYIQSMTKPIVSVAFMTLYEQGHFSLTYPVSKFIPEFENLKVIEVQTGEDGTPTGVEYVDLVRPVEIWHLLSHTAGFSHGLGPHEYDQKLSALLYPEMQEKPGHANIESRVKALMSYPLMGQPGEQWNYSASPDVLAYLIQIITGKNAEQYLQEVVFDPLGMTTAGYNVKDQHMDRVAGLHMMSEAGELAPVPQWSPLQGNTVFGGTHGLFCSAEDYMTFSRMLVNGGSYKGARILSPKTIELMTESFTDEVVFRPGHEFGLGFGVRTDVGQSKLSGSEGAYYWGGAFNTYFFVDPEEDLVAILMTQSWPYTDFYANKLRQMVYSAMSN